MRNSSITSQLGEKTGATHVENHVDPALDALDSIELTETGKFSWLISITAAIGGMLFGYVELARVYRATYLTHYSDTIPALSQLS